MVKKRYTPDFVCTQAGTAGGGDAGCGDPNYGVTRYVRDGAGRLLGVFDGDGQLEAWNVYGAGLVGRLKPAAPIVIDEAESLARAAAVDTSAAAWLHAALAYGAGVAALTLNGNRGGTSLGLIYQRSA